MPVIINEVLVRASYFVRHFIMELKEKNDVSKMEWGNVIPFNNRTIIRMMTIASGTFTAVDLADAAIHAAPKSVDPSIFFANMLLRVNFVGVGRFTIAVATDAGMGIVREVKRNQRIRVIQEQVELTDAKLFYKQADVWLTAEETGKAVEATYARIDETTKEFSEAFADIEENLDRIDEHLPEAEIKNPGLINDIENILEWE